MGDVITVNGLMGAVPVPAKRGGGLALIRTDQPLKSE